MSYFPIGNDNNRKNISASEIQTTPDRLFINSIEKAAVANFVLELAEIKSRLRKLENPDAIEVSSYATKKVT